MKYMRSKVALGLFFTNIISLSLIMIFSIVRPKTLTIFFTSIPAMALLLMLLISFFLTDNECCDSNSNNCAIGSCCGCCAGITLFDFLSVFSGKDSGEAVAIAIMILAVFAVFVGIYFLFHFMGKHITRIVCIILVTILELVILIMAFIALSQRTFNANYIIIIIASIVSIICNLLGIILPNFSYFDILSYEHKEAKDTFKIEQPLSSQIPLVVQQPNNYNYNETPEAPNETPMAPIYNNNSGFDAAPAGYQQNEYNITPN